MTARAESDKFWNDLKLDTLQREADVELRLILPMLKALGYTSDEITPKAPVVFQTGRRGRKHEADFIVHFGERLNAETSLLVVEAKAPTENLEAGRNQAESYAHATRAPFLLLCNGINFEIWQTQINQSSERVFNCPVHALHRNRGTIERLIARGSAIAHCRTLGYKSLATVANDISNYILNETSRSVYINGIDRRLRTGFTSAPAFLLLSETKRGAFVLGASGYGKTTLAQDFHHRSLAMISDSDPVSFYLPLPDLATLNLSPEHYARERLAARCPHFATDAAFIDLLESRGVRLICDGLDRIDSKAQRLFLAQAATLLRDRPKAEFFIFGRTAVWDHLDLPTFDLMPLNRDEQSAIAERVDGWGGRSILLSFPKMLQPLMEHPLLLTLLLEHRQRRGVLPSRLDDLFENWVARLLEVDGNSPARVARLRALLKRFAVAVGGATRARAAVLAAIGTYDDADLDALIKTGALAFGDQIELHHDALGDYLRAEALLDMSPSAIESRLPSTAFLPGAMFPSLLMARCRDPNIRDAIWKRIGQAGMDIYLDVTRFGSNTDHFSAGNLEKISASYLDDLLRGIVEPTNWYLAPLAPEIFAKLGDGQSNTLGVEGRITDDRWASFGFYLAKDGEPNLRLGAPKTRYKHGVHLDRFLGADNARALGVSKLREALASVIRDRRLEGGPLWWNERLLGRLRYAAQSWKIDIPLDMNFKALIQLLQPKSDKWVRFYIGDRSFRVSELLDDIERLREHGWRSADPWWEHLGGEPILHDADPSHTRLLLDEYSRRSQQVLSELVEHSFPRLSPSLNFYQAMPVRHTLHVHDIPNYGFGMSMVWFPVADWQFAGADVSFEEEQNVFLDQERYEKVMHELRRLGRTGCTTVDSRSGALPRFDGSHRNRRFDGETAVLRNSLELLVADLDGLFDRLPGKSIRSTALVGA